MTRSAGPSPNYVRKGPDFFISNSKKGTEYEVILKDWRGATLAS